SILEMRALRPSQPMAAARRSPVMRWLSTVWLSRRSLSWAARACRVCMSLSWVATVTLLGSGASDATPRAGHRQESFVRIMKTLGGHLNAEAPQPEGSRAGARLRGQATFCAAFWLPSFTSSLKSEPGRNFGTYDLATWMSAPVDGFRAARDGLYTISNEPKPTIATLSPAATAFCTASMIAL